MSASSTALAVAASAGAAALATRVLPGLLARGPGGLTRWERRNHAGRTVTLLGGPAWVSGATVGVAPSAPGLVAVVGPAALGVVDDLHGGADRRGLRGHLSALAQGRPTTGGLKVVGLLASGLLAVALADRADTVDEDRTHPWWAVAAGGALVAGSANLVNLFDLRPGRALKVTAVLAAGAALPEGPGRPAAAAALGASLACLPDDLAARTMLGDAGANPAGALVGLALARSTGAWGRVTALVLVTALTLASERVSFSRVIAEHPWLDRLDRLGRACATTTPA